MAGNQQRDDGPVAFVDAKVYASKSTGNKYIWSKTFDLDAVKRELGTNVVTLKVVVPKKRRENSTDDDRLVIISPSEAKYLPKKKNSSSQQGSYGGSGSNDDIVL